MNGSKDSSSDWVIVFWEALGYNTAWIVYWKAKQDIIYI